jgi:hypothetical protein
LSQIVFNSLSDLRRCGAMLAPIVNAGLRQADDSENLHDESPRSAANPA